MKILKRWNYFNYNVHLSTLTSTDVAYHLKSNHRMTNSWDCLMYTTYTDHAMPSRCVQGKKVQYHCFSYWYNQSDIWGVWKTLKILMTKDQRKVLTFRNIKDEVTLEDLKSIISLTNIPKFSLGSPDRWRFNCCTIKVRKI